MEKTMRHFALPLALFIAAPAALHAAQPAPEMPDAMPVCSSPQQISPAVPLGGGHNNAASIAWNGAEYAVVWADSGSGTPIKFRRYFADGTPAGPVIQISASGGSNYQPRLVWNGTGYGVTWTENISGFTQVFFARLDAFGTIIGSSIRVSFYLVTPPTAHSRSPSIAWSGSGYVVVWEDFRTFGATGVDIYLTELDASGNVARNDLSVSTAGQHQTAPVVVWSSQAGRYQIFWQDLRFGTNEIWGASMVPLSPPATFSSATVTAANSSDTPTLTDTGAGLGLSWRYQTGTNEEIYFARLNELGAKIGADLRITNDSADSWYPYITWTGAEYGIFWMDDRLNPNFSLWFQRVSAAGTPIGSNQQISTNGLKNPAAAFGKYGYLVEGASSSFPNNGLVIPWGCGTDSTAPSCPGNFFSYSVSGNAASVSWSPSGDNESDIAYYNVYRNNTPVAKTSSAYYNDTGLSLSTTYNYMIQPVNAWQRQNYSCTSAIYLTTNSSLTLTMNKSNPDAVLNWSNDGAGQYNVFRGNDPHQMQPIGQTAGLSAQDAGALNSSGSYFYSVDE
jgi:hypothetical protein